MPKIGKNAKMLIASDLIYSITAIFIETFLVAYFLKITNQSITTISIYYIVIYSLLAVGNLFLSKFIKTHCLKYTKILSLGITMRALFILFIVALGHNIADNYILIAVLYSLSETLYWIAHELIYIDSTTNENRKNFMSIKKILVKLASIIFPLILGTSIELYSFERIAVYILILSIIQILITMSIKIDKIKIKKTKYDFSYFLRLLKNNKLKKIRLFGLSSIAYGIIESSISTLIVIITVMTFKTSFNLGVLTTIFAICSILSLALYNKFYNRKTSNIILIICSVILVIGVFGLKNDINKISLII